MADKKQTFVNKLVKDPAKPPMLAALTGWVGEAAAKQHTRLYLDMELSSHVDIPDEIILNREDSQGEDPKQQQTHIWIDRGNLDKLSFSPARNLGGPGFPGGPINTTIPPLCGAPSPFCPPTQPGPLCPPASLQPPCGITVFPGCPPATLQPPCGFTSTPPACFPPTIQPPCGFTSSPPACPPPTIQPPCGFTSSPPACPPPTVLPPCGGITSSPPACLPPTIQPPCGITSSPPACLAPTIQPPCDIGGTAFGPVCPVNTLTPPCNLAVTASAPRCQVGPSAVDACPSVFCPPGGGFGGNFGGGGFGFNGG